VIALGRLGWSLRRIEGATDVRRETVSGYLKAAGVAVRGRVVGRRGGRRQIRPPRARCPPTRWPPSRPRWQDLIDHHGFASRHTSVRRYVRRAHARAVRHYRDGARRGSPGQLRRGTDGPRAESLPRLLRFHLQQEDEARAGLRAWHRPSARWRSSRATGCTIAKRICCWKC
jgi:hypothetical protein